jgi:glycosyltransferase involved in cell wall biosynthesis
MNKLLFFLDTARLGRPWSMAFMEGALSGTDSVTIETAKACRRAGIEVALLVTAAPEEVGGADLEVIVVDSFAAGCRFAAARAETLMIFPISHDLEQLAILAAASGGRGAYAGWAHNSPSFRWLDEAYRLPNLRHMIAVSNGQAAYTSHHPMFARCVVIPNLLNGAEWVTHSELRLETNQITYVGALKESKGFHLLADAWSRVAPRFGDWTLAVCGSAALYASKAKFGPYGLSDPQYEARILSSLGGSLQSASRMRVSFLGALPKRTLRRQLLNSKFVVVNPNWKGSVETFCMSAIEALALGRPVIGGDAGALPETVGQRIGGLLARSEALLERNLATLMDDEGLRHDLAEAGQARVTNRYLPDAVVPRWRKLAQGGPLTRYPYDDRSAFPAGYPVRRFIGTAVPPTAIRWIRALKKAGA